MRKPRLAPLILGTAAFLGLLGCAQTTLAYRLVDVTVVNRDTGERLTPYQHRGRLYVAGTPGERYAVELRSRSGERLLTVVSVDGVNVLTGQTAAAPQSGYVLDGRSSYAINGWRKSMDDVAQFVFTALPDSYAARTGRPDNVGVIGVAVFREKRVARPLPYSRAPDIGRSEPRPQAAEEASRDAAGESRQSPTAPLAKSESAAGIGGLADRRDASPARPELDRKRLGTGHGEREHSPTSYTDFVRAGDAPDEVVTLYYDSRANLIARGVIRAPRPVEPAPFPGGVGFVPDPQG